MPLLVDFEGAKVQLFLLLTKFKPKNTSITKFLCNFAASKSYKNNV
jgi:hypothetical protein